jgi:hypothetical protein
MTVRAWIFSQLPVVAASSANARTNWSHAFLLQAGSLFQPSE